MSSVARRAGSKLVELLVRSTDPATLASVAQFYSKTVLGSAELYVKSGFGVVDQMTGPGAVLPTEYISGLQLSWTTVAQVTVAAGRCRDSTDVFDIALAAPTVANMAVSGAGGLDTGAEAGNTWYAVYVIGNIAGANPPATLLSANFTTPTLPGGYDIFRRVGCVRNNAGSNFIAFNQRHSGRSRRYWYDEDRANLQVLTNGASLVYAVVVLTALVPTTSANVVMQVEFLAPTVGGGNADLFHIHPTGANEATGPMQWRTGAVALASSVMQGEMPCSDGLVNNQQVEYKVDDADDLANLYVLGFDDEI